MRALLSHTGLRRLAASGLTLGLFGWFLTTTTTGASLARADEPTDLAYQAQDAPQPPDDQPPPPPGRGLRRPGGGPPDGRGFGPGGPPPDGRGPGRFFGGPPPQPPVPPVPPVPPMPPILSILDKDADGILSAAEIEGASKALKALDTNDDGKLTADELRSGLRHDWFPWCRRIAPASDAAARRKRATPMARRKPAAQEDLPETALVLLPNAVVVDAVRARVVVGAADPVHQRLPLPQRPTPTPPETTARRPFSACD